MVPGVQRYLLMVFEVLGTMTAIFHSINCSAELQSVAPASESLIHLTSKTVKMGTGTIGLVHPGFSDCQGERARAAWAQNHSGYSKVNQLLGLSERES